MSKPRRYLLEPAEGHMDEDDACTARQIILAVMWKEAGMPSLKGLRALRLWHWRQRAGHHVHMQAVQLLNDFFPAEDTAEKDDK